MKLELDIKKITNNDISKSGKFNILNNTFTTFVKKTNQLNEKYIYTDFEQQIENSTMREFDFTSIKAIIIDNIGRLYIGGNFNRIGNLSCNNVAMWDGKRWNNLDYGVNGQVVSLGIDGNNNLFVGGSFAGTFNGLVKSKNIIMWNTYSKNWVSLDGGVNSNVVSINKLSDGNIVIAGYFTSSMNSLTLLEKIAYWNKTNWVNLGGDFLIDKNIYASAIDKSDNIYVGGYYGTPVSVYNWSSKLWSVLADKDSNILSQTVNAVLINPITSNPIFGGIIENFGSPTITNVFNVVEFDINTNTWIPLTNSDGYGLDSQCNVLFYDKINERMIAGGSFEYLTNNTTNGQILNLVASWDFDKKEWTNLGSGITGNYVEALEISSSNELFIGGFIGGSKNVWSNGIVIYTNNYVDLFFKNDLLYTLTNFRKSITISINKCLKYIFSQKQ
jgi:hypothetical protein